MSEPEELSPVSPERQAELEEAVSLYAANLWEAEDPFDGVAAYLARRGLTEETIRTARLGEVGDDCLPEHEKYIGWWAIPYLDAKGMPLTVRFRCVQDHDCKEKGHGKYATLPGDRGRLYNIGACHADRPDIDICEGEGDALILQQLGYNPVAVPGATSWADHFTDCVDGFSPMRIWADGDDAGLLLATKLKGIFPHARAMRLPRGKDVTDVFKAYGEHGIRTLAEGGKL